MPIAIVTSYLSLSAEVNKSVGEINDGSQKHMPQSFIKEVFITVFITRNYLLHLITKCVGLDFACLMFARLEN